MGYVPDMTSRISRIYALRLLDFYNRSIRFNMSLHFFLFITVFKCNMYRQAAYMRCVVAVTTISHTVELLSELEVLMCSRLVSV